MAPFVRPDAGRRITLLVRTILGVRMSKMPQMLLKTRTFLVHLKAPSLIPPMHHHWGLQMTVSRFLASTP